MLKERTLIGSVEEKLSGYDSTLYRFWEVRIKRRGIHYSEFLKMLKDELPFGIGVEKNITELLSNRENASKLKPKRQRKLKEVENTEHFMRRVDELIENGGLENFSHKEELIYFHLPRACELIFGGRKNIGQHLMHNRRFIRKASVFRFKMTTRVFVMMSDHKETK